MDKQPLLHENQREHAEYSTFPGPFVHPSDIAGEITVNVVNGEITPSSAANPINPETKVYKRRWYILLVYCLVAASQGGYWNTWGPISASSEEAFGWTDADIALLSNWGPIAYIVSAIFFSWVIDVKGIRIATLSTAILVAAGAGVRCITDEPPYVSWTVHIGQLLNGLGGPVAMGLPPALSATWFPPNERTTATALANILNSFGVGASFLIGPYMVSSKPPANSTTNNTVQNSSRLSSFNGLQDFLEKENSSDSKTYRISQERKEIMKLMYVEFGFAAFAMLLVLIYFPDKPAIPPSKTASLDRLNFTTGLKGLMRNSRFWLICFIYGLSLGVFNCWQSVLDVNLKPHNIKEDEAGWLGFYSIIAAAVSALVVAKFADAFSKHMKLFLLFLYIGGAGCFVWFTLLVNGYIPNSVVSLYVSIILGTLLLNASPPLFYETACEVTYPVAEGVTNLVLTLMNNVGGLIFLLVQMIPGVGVVWENWALLGAIGICIPALCLLHERYNRLEIDEDPKQ